MTITSIRFRTEGAFIVLQVEETTRSRFSSYHSNEDEVAWRDAKVEDMLSVSGFTSSRDDAQRLIAQMEHRIDRLDSQLSMINNAGERV